MPRTRTVLALAVCTGLTLIAIPALAGGPAKPLPHVSRTSPTGMYAEGASLVSGRLVNPVGTRTTLAPFPVSLVVSPDKRTGVVVNSGQGEGRAEQGDQSLQVVDLGSGKVVQTVRDHLVGQDTFYNAGLAFRADGKRLFATGGGNDTVYDYAVNGQQLTLKHRWKSSAKSGAPSIPGGQAGNGIPHSAPLAGDVAAFSRGLALVPDGSSVVVTNEQGSTVAGLSTADGHLLWETTLAGAGQAGGAYPGAVTISGSTALVTAQGLNSVALLDTATGALKGLVPVGDHPVSVTVTQDGRQAWVANANDDSVSVLDLTATPVTQVAQYATHLVPGEANGSTPDAIAVDSDRAYVALAGDNAVQVMQRSDGKVLGSIPTGAYPTAVAVVGRQLLTAAAKGLGSVPVTNRNQYDGNDMFGLLSLLPLPADLSTLTRKARAYLLHPTTANALRPKGSPIPDESHKGQSPIKHVVMVVRENRTFDQVFGDLQTKGADADPRFLEFGLKDRNGKTVTPNAHALATRFGLSQNFYSDGEASIQGHHWTAEGTSTDYTEKSWVHYYSNRYHPYDPTAAIVYPRCGAVFQQLAAQGKTFRNFGELVGLQVAQAPTLKAAPQASCATPGGTYDPISVANFDNTLGANLSLTTVSDVDKEAEFERQYAPLVATDQVPQFSYVVLGNDHTDGTTAGKKTPQAHVATNDLAVGKLVDYLSHTKQWSSTAVFVVEDDSQDGLDHRDGHRNIALVASPYVRQGALSTLHIDQASVLRTMELVLGLQAMSSYTQYAAVPYDLFSTKPDLTPYTAITPTYDMAATNPAATTGTPAVVPLDLSQVDLAGPVLEAQAWQATRPGEPMPSALLRELAARGRINPEALAAWAKGVACLCDPRSLARD
ncbi:MAG: beta-propeller repeat protein [Frankiales bacterium]|nr:beta-propeller repeat protein [Frankiales bacterium]